MKEETIVSNWNEKGLGVFLKRRPKNEDLRPKTPLTKTKTLWTKTKTPLTKTKTPWTKTKTLWTKTKTPLTKTKNLWKRRPLWQQRRPSPSPHFHFLALVSFLAAKTENPVPRSFFATKPNGNACYAGYTEEKCCRGGNKRVWIEISSWEIYL